MLKSILFLIIFAIFDQECAGLDFSSKQIILEDCYSVFNPNTDKVWKDNKEDMYSVFNINLDQLKGFDFFRLTINGYYVSSHIEGVIQYKNGEVAYIKLHSGNDTIGHLACGACAKSLDCDICPLIKSKLRNGIFYLGNNRSLIQNEQGDVVYDASLEQPPKKLTLFQNFKKLQNVTMDDNYIVLQAESPDGKPCIVYNPVTNTKHIARVFYPLLQDDYFYPLLQDDYYEKYPWKNEVEFVDANQMIKINQYGDLVLQNNTFSCWISACTKLIFGKILFVPINNSQFEKLFFLKSLFDNNSYAFDPKDKKFYSIENTPEFDEYEINEWFYCGDKVIFKPFKQSLIGYYVGAYLVILRSWFINCKNYFTLSKKTA